MKLAALFAAVALALAPAPPAAAAPFVITYNEGGMIGSFVMQYLALQQVGANVVIDGACISACTVVTAFIDADKVCVTQRARLAFHSASEEDGKFAFEATRMLWTMYPEAVRTMLRAKGWDGDMNKPHPDLVWISNAELRTLYRTCPSPSA